MSEPFLAEIRILGFNFAPRGWAQCDGQILPINQNQSLYSLLGTTYGGDGRTNFALPDLRGRTPIHVGSSNGTSHTLGSKSGEENHTLSASEMPQHRHPVTCSQRVGTEQSPVGANRTLGSESTGATAPYADRSTAGGFGTMQAGLLNNVGGGQSHNNMQPFLTLNFCIALTGLFPSRN